MPVAELRKEATKRSVNIFYIPLDKSVIPSIQDLNEFSSLEDIIMIGYPDDIWDYVNNKPIFRKRITAIHPKFDYYGCIAVCNRYGMLPGIKRFSSIYR